MVEFKSSQSIKSTNYNLPKPKPAYYPHEGSKLYANKDLYKSIHEAPKTLISKHRCAKRDGIAVKIPAKSIVRITTPEGPQVCDLNIWNLNDKRERLWVARTAQLHSYHVSTYDRLWSNLPFLRPLVTITGDSLGPRKDEHGGRVHGTRCDPYVDRLLSGEHNDYHCHSNLYRAIKPHGLDEFDVHDVLNVFQVTGLSEESDQYFMETCPAKPGDYFEMFAEIDLLVAISACPGGDLSMWEFGETEDSQSKMEDCCRPLEIEVYKIDNEDKVLQNWEAPNVVDYKGNHGIKK
ncbi:uncharacterized protein KGF55_002975 [Candida pseudojiufengensis]|uniref:uncharacterized protein n=1 Tax=Candida pseudojiufengensis TaxID=497109 RepID=UPI002224FFB9|nr:uncharacterized protein KGF55_002975 [Candida pseudojiufengensis]KAI5963183.1 hypothetical protein KGF55_002975 [Candida pseudojiufengensis]